MDLTRKLISYLLITLFAFHFVSTKLCFHTHQLPCGKIVHSHPFGSKSHTHSSLQFELISSLDSYDVDNYESIHVNPEIRKYIISELCCSAPSFDSIVPYAFGLKAPPAYIM